MSTGGINEVRCGCGESFASVEELITHAREDHGVNVR